MKDLECFFFHSILSGDAHSSFCLPNQLVSETISSETQELSFNSSRGLNRTDCMFCVRVPSQPQSLPSRSFIKKLPETPPESTFDKLNA